MRNLTAAPKSSANFSRGEGRAGWSTWGTKQMSFKSHHYTALCCVQFSEPHTLKVTKTKRLYCTRAFPKYTMSVALAWDFLIFHDLILAGFGVEFRDDSHVWKCASGVKGMKEYDAYEISSSDDGIKRFELCFSVWSAAVKQVWTQRSDKMTQRRVSIWIFFLDLKSAGRAYVVFFMTLCPSVAWLMTHTCT